MTQEREALKFDVLRTRVARLPSLQPWTPDIGSLLTSSLLPLGRGRPVLVPDRTALKGAFDQRPSARFCAPVRFPSPMLETQEHEALKFDESRHGSLDIRV